jgi:hypothetical protein
MRRLSPTESLPADKAFTLERIRTLKGQKKMRMYRQGDVLLVACDEIPAEATTVKRDAGRVILAYGEVTGHAHAIVEPSVEKHELKLADGITEYLSAPHGATIVHEEHDTIELPMSNYRIVHQREYSPQEIRRVLD